MELPEKADEAEVTVVSTGAAGPGLIALSGILASQDQIHIKQKVSLLEGATGGCCEKKNRYMMTSGIDGQGAQLLEAYEESSCCDRHCCKPIHSRTVYVYPAGQAKEQALLSIDHPGCEFMCCLAPRPCIGECAVMECCLDEVKIYDGYVEGKPGHLEGSIISSIKQPPMGGMCTPTLVVDGKNYIEGPMCFGGWSECCVDSKFTLSTAAGGKGDIASFKHLKPKDCGGACREACTDSDNFGVTFEAGVTGEQKADTIASALFVDFLFFERDQGLCYVENNVIYCTCCLCYCIGNLIPCNVCIPLPKGAPPSPENASGAPPCPEESVMPVEAEAPMDRTGLPFAV